MRFDQAFPLKQFSNNLFKFATRLHESIALRNIEFKIVKKSLLLVNFNNKIN